jgi:chromosome segregation ATPase
MINLTTVKEKLESKLKSLEAEREKLVANLNAYAGAIETVKGLLADLEADAKEEVKTVIDIVETEAAKAARKLKLVQKAL